MSKNDNEKSIDTPELMIKGNIMSWPGTMIQLSNISCISTSALSEKPFPNMAAGIIILGLLGFKFNAMIAVIVVLIGAAWIYVWSQENKERKTNTRLSIIMNSGNSLQFVISNKKFLDNILKVLEKIIISGGVGNQQVSINIKDCKISGSARLFEGLNINQ